MQSSGVLWHGELPFHHLAFAAAQCVCLWLGCQEVAPAGVPLHALDLFLSSTRMAQYAESSCWTACLPIPTQAYPELGPLSATITFDSDSYSDSEVPPLDHLIALVRPRVYCRSAGRRGGHSNGHSDRSAGRMRPDGCALEPSGARRARPRVLSARALPLFARVEAGKLVLFCDEEGGVVAARRYGTRVEERLARLALREHALS
eukprot:365442-Chlamydomonas_euryale.AAC.9